MRRPPSWPPNGCCAVADALPFGVGLESRRSFWPAPAPAQTGLVGRQPAAVRRLFNALNYGGRRGADSTEWADEPTETSLLKRARRCGRSRIMTFFAKVRVAGSSPVVRSTKLAVLAAVRAPNARAGAMPADARLAELIVARRGGSRSSGWRSAEPGRVDDARAGRTMDEFEVPRRRRHWTASVTAGAGPGATQPTKGGSAYRPTRP